MKKVVLKLVSVHDEQDKQKALNAVSSVSGIQSLGMDIKDQKMTIIGDIDPVNLVSKLRKKWHTEVISIGAPDVKKENEVKKDDEKKEEDGKKSNKTEAEEIADLVKATKMYYQTHHPCMFYHHHYCY